MTDQEIVEIGAVDYQLRIGTKGSMPPFTVDGVEFSYKAAAMLEDGKLIVIFVPPPEQTDEKG